MGLFIETLGVHARKRVQSGFDWHMPRREQVVPQWNEPRLKVLPLWYVYLGPPVLGVWRV